MRRKLMTVFALGFLLLSSISTANALVIGFNELNNVNSLLTYSSLNTNGFNFTNSYPSNSSILIWQRNSLVNADSDGATYSHNIAKTISTLTQIGGGAFDLTSLDIGNVYNSSPYSQMFNFIGHKNNGTDISTTFTSDALSGLQTVTLNWTDLNSFTFTELTGSWLQADNFVINENTAPVPEPGTMVLLGLGMAGLAVYGKRRQNKKA